MPRIVKVREIIVSWAKILNKYNQKGRVNEQDS